MNISGMAELLSEVLETQIESGQFGVLDEKRFREALTTGTPLSDEDQKLLLLSPVARADFRRLQGQISDELTIRLNERKVNLELFPLAAASDEDDNSEAKVIMQGSGFNVTLYRQDNIGIPWVILVQLNPSYLEAINPMTVLHLVDSGGLEWLRGKPDANGEITASWNDAETDILARSRRFSLKLEPV